MDVKRASRVAFVLVVALCALFLGSQYVAYATGGTVTQPEEQADLPVSERTPIAPPSDGITVVAGQGQQGAARFSGRIAAFAPDGRLLYYNDSLNSYFDVDPSPAGDETVTYVGSIPAKDACVAPFGRYCNVNVVERTNLTTGETERLYSTTSRLGKWHDVDRINETHLLVADIGMNQVFILNTSSGLTTWRWQAKTDYPLSGGGRFPTDWTHLNDVQYLDDGTIMVSLRNQDQVVFIDRKTGLVRERTLGSEDDHDTLYEQHNPDYLPPEQGGPAVLVADSENNRVVEYQRVEGAWEQSWVWRDADLPWPRDADRLPNGNTLITSSNGDTVFEVSPSGEVVWQMDFLGPYESERLSTGDESAGGPSAARANLTSVSPELDQGTNRHRGGLHRTFWIQIKNFIPSPVLNALVFIRPPWLSNIGLTVVALFVGTLGLWAVAEWRWSSLNLRWPVRRDD